MQPLRKSKPIKEYFAYGAAPATHAPLVSLTVGKNARRFGHMLTPALRARLAQAKDKDRNGEPDAPEVGNTSEMGQKRTNLPSVFDVRCSPESGHERGNRVMSA